MESRGHNTPLRSGTADLPNPPTFDVLPNELILEIFYFHLENDNIGYPNVLRRLAQVCVRWRDLVLSHPDFWTVVDQSFGERWLQWAVKRAASLPLTYIIQSATGLVDIAPHNFLDFIQKNMRSCDNLVILFHRYDVLRHIPDVLGPILEAPPPAIHSFAIDTTHDQHDYDYDHVEFLHRNIRGVRFRMLSVLQICFRWNSPLAKDLTALELSGSLNGRDTPPIPFLELLRTIQESPSLRVFDAYRISVTPPPPSHSLPRPIRLLNLESFSVGLLDNKMLAAILSCIEAPKCSTVRILCHTGGQSLSTELNTLMLHSVFSGVGKRVKYITLDISSDQGLDGLLFKWKDTSEVNITLRFLHAPDCRDSLQHILAITPDSVCPFVSSLEVYSSGSDSLSGVLPILEEKFRRVRNILLGFTDTEDWQGAVEFLSGAQGRLPWPSLSMFFVEAGPSCHLRPSHFLDILRPRAESWSRWNSDDPDGIQAAKLSRMEVQGGRYVGFGSAEVNEIYSLVHKRVKFCDL